MLHFIVNPVSRTGKSLRIWKKKIEPVLSSKKIAYSLDFSKERGDVTKICASICKKYSHEKKCIVVILGGDGTLNDAVQGISDFDRTVIAYIPTGSSNDFARDMKIPRSVKKILRNIIAQKKIRSVDLGEVETSRKMRLFVVSSGLGFDAAVCQRSSHSFVKKTLNKFGLGKLTYLSIALNQIVHAPEADCVVEFSDGKKLALKKFLFAASMVHRYEGGGFKFCPKADCTDGKMNLCAVNGKSVAGVLAALPAAFFGMHHIFPGIQLMEFSEATIKTTVPLWLHTDGEVWQKADEVKIRTSQKKLQVLF